MKRLISLLLVAFLLLCSACSAGTPASGEASSTTATSGTESSLPDAETTVTTSGSDDYMDASLAPERRAALLLSQMTLEEKAGQMLQGAFYAVKASDLTANGLGSVLSGGGGVPSSNTIEGWQKMVDSYQKASMATRLKIPFLYGIDAVHGHNNVYGAVVFPQNIGLGAANDPDLMYQMGAAVADEMKLTHTLWNFSPCVAVAQDPRWGRTYESYSSDTEIVTALALSYAKGQMDNGVIPTAKHYAGDGGTVFGTGEGDYLIDRGDTELSEADFRSIHLKAYKDLVDAGVPVVMASFSSINGVKMSENKYYLTDVLKNEFGFKGFVVSDWEAVSGLSGDSFAENVCLAVNAGVDMLMEPTRYADAGKAIVDGVNSGVIPEARVDDAVLRILTVKFEYGLFEDPYMKNLQTKETKLGSDEYRAIAEKLVEKSLVLLKNEGDVLPLKKGQKILVTGPAADDIGAQCGGWTKTWQGITDKENGGPITEGTTILDGLKEYGKEIGIEFFTDKSRIDEADAVICAIGEKPYAEYEGDSEDLSLLGSLGLSGNKDALTLAQTTGKPVIALIVAGREVNISQYLGDFDAAVMCFLPGSEGEGVAAVLTGKANFTGKLPMPWYQDASQIGAENPKLLFEKGYGLAYA